MSSVANWSYTATATIWRKLEGNDEYGDPLGYAEPEQILCDYEGGLSKKLASLGAEIVVKNTVWTEYALAARLIKEGRINVKPIITATLPFERAVEAFEMAADRKAHMKVQLTF